MDKMDNHELISALADGQLQGEAFVRGVELASTDADGRQAWSSYHLIGETLRAGRPAGGAGSEAFLARLQQRLAEEPAVPVLPVVREPAVVPETPAANDWRWKLVAGVASVAAVGAVAWNVWAPGVQVSAQPQLAAAPAVVVPVAADARGTVTMIRDPRLDELLAAHRQLGGAGALQTSSGFLRNATFEGPSR